MSHSSMSAAEFGAEDLLRSLSQVRLGLERREERQVPSLPTMLRYPATDQFQSWPDLVLGKLIHQLMSSSRIALIDTVYGSQASVLRLVASIGASSRR